ncbi:MAG: hypothetical protein Q9159_005486 [Coniocarpon cinnabarinum]
MFEAADDAESTGVLVESEMATLDRTESIFERKHTSKVLASERGGLDKYKSPISLRGISVFKGGEQVSALPGIVGSEEILGKSNPHVTILGRLRSRISSLG